MKEVILFSTPFVFVIVFAVSIMSWSGILLPRMNDWYVFTPILIAQMIWLLSWSYFIKKEKLTGGFFRDDPVTSDGVRIMVILVATGLFIPDLMLVVNKIDPELNGSSSFLFGIFFAMLATAVAVASGEAVAEHRTPFSELDQERII